VRELTIARAGRCPAWGLPQTASNDERQLAEAERPIARRSGLVVCAARSETAWALADACRLGGYETRPIDELRPPAIDGVMAIVWDTTAERACDGQIVARLRAACGDAPLIATIGFPRADDCPRAAAAGVAAIVSKPYHVRDLLGHLARIHDGTCPAGAARPR
jgi:hypothetical protein